MIFIKISPRILSKWPRREGLFFFTFCFPGEWSCFVTRWSWATKACERSTWEMQFIPLTWLLTRSDLFITCILTFKAMFAWTYQPVRKQCFSLTTNQPYKWVGVKINPIEQRLSTFPLAMLDCESDHGVKLCPIQSRSETVQNEHGSVHSCLFPIRKGSPSQCRRVP